MRRLPEASIGDAAHLQIEVLTECASIIKRIAGAWAEEEEAW